MYKPMKSHLQNSSISNKYINQQFWISICINVFTCSDVYAIPYMSSFLCICPLQNMICCTLGMFQPQMLSFSHSCISSKISSTRSPMIILSISLPRVLTSSSISPVQGANLRSCATILSSEEHDLSVGGYK